LFIHLFVYLFILVGKSAINTGAIAHFISFYSVSLKLQHPLTLIAAGPSSCSKSTFVIRILEYTEQLCDIAFKNTVWCHSENNTPHHWQSVSFVKGVPEFESPENVLQ